MRRSVFYFWVVWIVVDTNTGVLQEEKFDSDESGNEFKIIYKEGLDNEYLKNE